MEERKGGPRGGLADGRTGLAVRRAGPAALRGAALAAGLCLAVVACGTGEGAGGGTPDADRESGEVTPASSATQDTTAGGAPGAPAPAGTDAPSPGTARITVGGHPVTVEIADDEAKRQRGLMHRESLPEDHGMLFVYERERELSFWMRNTLIALDVAFIDRSGRIVDIQQMEPMTDETHSSRAPALYALELRQGWFEDHGVKVGDRVEF